MRTAVDRASFAAAACGRRFPAASAVWGLCRACEGPCRDPVLSARNLLCPQDPEAVKPEDWDERETIPDEADVKPEVRCASPPTALPNLLLPAAPCFSSLFPSAARILRLQQLTQPMRPPAVSVVELLTHPLPTHPLPR